MSESRRSFFRNATILGAGLMTWTESLLAQKFPPKASAKDAQHPTRARGGSMRGKSHARPASMQSPDIPDLPFSLDGGTKVFRLVAEPLKRKIVPWKTLDVWATTAAAPAQRFR
jgi:hypothetical protein